MSRPASNWRRCNMPSVGHCSSLTKSCWLLRIGDSLTYLMWGGGCLPKVPPGARFRCYPPQTVP